MTHASTVVDGDGHLYASYENYSETSASYDHTRAPVGVELILDLLTQGGIDPGHARLLDAGSGTGNYLVALSGRVASLAGLEFNQGMLARARDKLDQVQNVSLHQGSILAMPFPDASFDAVMFNQVLHHLDQPGDTASPAWPSLIRALAECQRVLRTGGVLVINTCAQEQITYGCWYNALVPAAVARMARRYVPLETLARLLEQGGFEVRGSQPVQELFSKRYLDPAGPFEKSWRDGDSLWSLATEAELEAGLETLRTLHASGQADAFVRENDRARQALGQSVTLSARRR